MTSDAKEASLRKLAKRAINIMVWEIYKAEERGVRMRKQQSIAAEALCEEYPYISKEEALLHAGLLFDSIHKNRRKYAEKKKRAERKIHRPTNPPEKSEMIHGPPGNLPSNAQRSFSWSETELMVRALALGFLIGLIVGFAVGAL